MEASPQNSSQVSILREQRRKSKLSWKFGRLLFLALAISVTITAYFLPMLPFRLPLCLFKLMTGYPCAGCGMTRAFEAAAHGHFKEAFEWHPVGLALFFAMWLGAIFATYELLTNQPFDWEGWMNRHGALVVWVLFFALLAIWLLRLSYYRFGQWLPLPLKFPL